ncbi:FtsX-like permease family protein [Patescibacteria group bacterium]|nr:FtsX-like permease family protein [Patescibacteria group bacterium]
MHTTPHLFASGRFSLLHDLTRSSVSKVSSPQRSPAHILEKHMRWFLISLRLFLGACGMMTLAVGSIGVANIMFLIITERTYEIGLRKAIGATDRQIFLQLLLEALIIIGIGAVFGFMRIGIFFCMLKLGSFGANEPSCV